MIQPISLIIANNRALRKFLLIFVFILTACAPVFPLPAGTPQPTDTPSADYSVQTHPDGPLYVGDQVSFEVFSPSKFQPEGRSIRVSLAGSTLDETKFQPFGVGQRSQATFFWVWDTRDQQAGNHVLTFTLVPDGTQWTKTVTLLPASDLPAAEKNALWKTAESQCCTIHYISGTDAEKNLDALKLILDAQAADVEKRMSATLNGKIPFTFLPRTLGHGGFTSDGIYVSYLSQNYAGSATAQVAHHEMVHWLDNQLGGKLRPTILVEGLAVYLSDGHFKVEPIPQRAAVILELGWYIPLRQLTDSFYISQHEIGYAEAAALINYLVNIHGWDAFNAFYRDIHPASSGSQSDALDAALKAHFKVSLDQLDKDFIAYLRQQVIDDTNRSDMRLTVAFFDTVRRYQREMDPSAYFLTAWLPDVPEMRKRGIVADFVRHPVSQINFRIEGLLVSADANLRAANYTQAEVDIRAVNILLDLTGQFGK